MAVEAQLGVERKVGTELDEQRPEVLIDEVAVVVVDVRRGRHQPRVGVLAVRPAPPHGTRHPCLLLRDADEQHSLGARPAAQIVLRTVVFALPSLKPDQVDPLLPDEALDGRHEVARPGCQQRRRWHLVAADIAQVMGHARRSLQQRHIDVQIHAVDALQL